MLQIELDVDNDKYKGLEDLLATYCKSLSYDCWLGAYIFEIQNHAFLLSLLFALQTHVNNKDNWVEEEYPWDDDITLIINFKDEHSVFVKIYDFYVE